MARLKEGMPLPRGTVVLYNFNHSMFGSTTALVVVTHDTEVGSKYGTNNLCLWSDNLTWKEHLRAGVSSMSFTKGDARVIGTLTLQARLP